MSLVVPASEPCSFCEYLQGRRRFTILERHKLTATLVAREQRGRGHVLVIPINHRETILDLAPAEAAALMTGVTRAVSLVARAYAAEGVAVWQNNGVPAHQTVPHVHFHVAATLPEGGTNWGSVPRLSIDETDAIADRLRSNAAGQTVWATETSQDGNRWLSRFAVAVGGWASQGSHLIRRPERRAGPSSEAARRR